MNSRCETPSLNDAPPRWWEVGAAIVGFVMLGIIFGILTSGVFWLFGVSDVWIFHISTVIWIVVIWIRCMFL